MKFYLDGIWVYFPYDHIYPEQYEYMLNLKRSLDLTGPCTLEMPTGTGKTVSLLSLIISWILAHRGDNRAEDEVWGGGNRGGGVYGRLGYKLIYCCRTLGEIDKTVAELKNVWKGIKSHLDHGMGGLRPRGGRSSDDEGLLAICLSTRKRMCINPEVNCFSKRVQVDAQCRDRTAPHNRLTILGSLDRQGDLSSVPPGLCPYYEGYEALARDLGLDGIYSFDDLVELGGKKKVCPYFLARGLLPLADVIVYSYQYILNPRISQMVSQQLKDDCIVVFDEAHNIDNTCIEALSVEIKKHIVNKAQGNLRRLRHKVEQLEQVDASKLQKEYQALVKGLRQLATSKNPTTQTTSDSTPNLDQNNLEDRIFDSSMDFGLFEPFFQDAAKSVFVPDSIIRAKSFLEILNRIVTFIRNRLRQRQVTQEPPTIFISHLISWIGSHIDENTPEQVSEPKNVDPKSGTILQHCSKRLQSLLRTLELKELDTYHPLATICDFISIMAAYMDEGFTILMIPHDERMPTIPDPVLYLSCMDASICIKFVLQKFSRVILTSGTLSPITMLPKILGMKPVHSVSLSMTLTRPSVCPLVITRGTDQTQLSTKFAIRNEPDVVRNFALLLLTMTQNVPDGIVCFFPSYQYLETIISMWNEMGIVNELIQHKLIFVETEDFLETQVALTSYKQACSNGRGAIFLSVARGKVSEGVDFDHHYGRCVILFGIPFLYTENKILKARLEFLRNEHQIRENDFLVFDAMRMAAQCVGRVLRGKSDYGIMIFADQRYSRLDKRTKLPPWITQFMPNSHFNLSTDGAISLVKQFLKLMAQPLPIENQLGISLWDIDTIKKKGPSQVPKYTNTTTDPE